MAQTSNEMKWIEILVGLPHEIVFNILSRVPVEELIRLWSVSKSWYYLLSNPEFNDFLFRHAPSKPQLNSYKILVSKLGSFQSLDYESSYGDISDLKPLNFKFQKNAMRFRIVGSCNGLVCLCGPICNDHSVFLWNPSTGVYKKLPSIPRPCPDVGGCYTGYGFGYDSASNDYKVVMISLFNHLAVFSLKQNSWKLLPRIMLGFQSDTFGLFCNGALHWFYQGIVAFSLSTEEFYEVPYPSAVKAWKWGFGKLGVIEDCLCYCNYYIASYEGSCTLWVLEEYGGQKSWVKRATLFRGEIYFCYFFQGEGILAPLCATQEGDIIMTGRALVQVKCHKGEGPGVFLTSSGMENIKEFLENPPYFEAIRYVENSISPYIFQSNPWRAGYETLSRQ